MDRLIEPYGLKKPSTIFVGSITDICEWEPEWIRNVLSTCILCDKHTFMFLTKNASVYIDWYFPTNCILGTTITKSGIEDKRNLAIMSKSPNRRFLSVEPLLGEIKMSLSESFDVIIVGAMTGPGAVIPKKSWIESIKHDNIFFKPSIRKYL
jgi:protein gp37